MIKVIFVCTGNICRSPSAEGVFRHLVNKKNLLHKFEIDSAGTYDYHVGEPPDKRSQNAIFKRGVDISNLRARKFEMNDFAYFDYILSMDQSHQRYLQSRCPSEFKYKLKLFLEYASGLTVTEVPDPYYGGANGFELVLDLIEAGAQGFLNHVISTHEIK